MSVTDLFRERACPCCYCGKPTWAINAVCKAPRCRAAEARYKARAAATRGSTDLGSGAPAASVTAPVSGPRSLP